MKPDMQSIWHIFVRKYRPQHSISNFIKAQQQITKMRQMLQFLQYVRYLNEKPPHIQGDEIIKLLIEIIRR